jgi:hypothetical protein
VLHLAELVMSNALALMGISSRPYFHTNLLFSSMEARSLGAVLGADLVPLPLCLGSVVPQLPSSRLHFRNYPY